MNVGFEGKTLIGEQVARALDAATTLRKFETKHHLFIEANPPELASALLKVPWVSWPARYLNIIAGYFGNDGWTACENSREKIVDGVAVAVHGLSDAKVRVPLVAKAPSHPLMGAPGQISHQSLN